MSRTRHSRKPTPTAERFASWEDAFAACRERNRPLRVAVDDDTRTVFPSGASRPAHPCCLEYQTGSDMHNEDCAAENASAKEQ